MNRFIRSISIFSSFWGLIFACSILVVGQPVLGRVSLELNPLISPSNFVQGVNRIGRKIDRKNNETNEANETIDFEKHFKDLNIEGSIIIKDAKNNRLFQYNPQRNARAFPVASTFKIPNSLIALETGVIPDEIAVLTWDGIPRALPEWNRDLNLREAFKWSAVWFYQVLARRVGFDRMEYWIHELKYGSEKIGTKETIDQFWLDGHLQITPEQQIEFLHRLYTNDLPFSKRSMAIVKDIMIAEKTPTYTIRAKTGWFGFGQQTQPNIGWYVGYVEKGENVYFFVANIDIRNEKDPAARLILTRRCLKDLGVLE